MQWLRLGAAQDKAHALRRLHEQEQRVRAVDRALAVAQREIDEASPRVDR